MPPISPAPRVSIVIPNWNGLHLLRPCLNSLACQKCPGGYEVVVVDNGSTDGSVAALEADYPWVRIVAERVNRGFAGGTNIGFAAARGELLVALNNDTEVEPDWLDHLVAALDRHPEAGMAASRMMVFSQPGILHSAGDIFGVDGIPNSRGVWQPFGPPFDAETYVFGACGGAALYRRELLDRVGSFDEQFFMYCEDVDLNWRAQLAGYRCIYAPDAVVHHHISASGGGRLSSFYVGRNTLWVLARNLPAALLRRHWRVILRAQWRIAVDAARSWRGVAARSRLRGQAVGLLTWPRWIGHRRRLLARSCVSLAYLESLLTREPQ